jgi:hypothetical protein
VWHGVGRFAVDWLAIDGPYVSRGYPKALKIFRTGLTSALLLQLLDRSTITFGPVWILQVLDDGAFSFETIAIDLLTSGSQALLDATASLRATETREVQLSTLENGHLRLAQAAVGVCPAVLDSPCHHTKADGANPMRPHLVRARSDPVQRPPPLRGPISPRRPLRLIPETLLFK